MSDDMDDGWAGTPEPDATEDGGSSPAPAPPIDQGLGEAPGYPGWTAGDFGGGNGLLGMTRISQQDPVLQPATFQWPGLPGGGGVGPVQSATRAVNGVPMAIFQPQPSQTGATGVGDIDAVAGSLSNLSPRTLERLSNANIAFVAVPDSTDQAYPNAGLLSQHPQGWPAGTDWGDVPGGYVDFSNDKAAQKLLSPTDPWRAVVVGPKSGTSSYDVADHETGHAWDDLNGANGHAASQLPEFQAAYAAETPNLLAQAKARTDANPADTGGYYYLQGVSSGTNLGAREAYAESFARYMAGAPNLKADWPSLYGYWQAQDRAQGLRSSPSNHRR